MCIRRWASVYLWSNVNKWLCFLPSSEYQFLESWNSGEPFRCSCCFFCKQLPWDLMTSMLYIANCAEGADDNFFLPLLLPTCSLSLPAFGANHSNRKWHMPCFGSLWIKVISIVKWFIPFCFQMELLNLVVALALHGSSLMYSLATTTKPFVPSIWGRLHEPKKNYVRSGTWISFFHSFLSSNMPSLRPLASISCCITSIHVFFGLPCALLTCPKLIRSTRRTGASIGLHGAWPNHLGDFLSSSPL